MEQEFGGDRPTGLVKPWSRYRGTKRGCIIFSVDMDATPTDTLPMSLDTAKQDRGQPSAHVYHARTTEAVEIGASVTSKDFSLSDAPSKGAANAPGLHRVSPSEGSQDDLEDSVMRSISP